MEHTTRAAVRLPRLTSIYLALALLTFSPSGSAFAGSSTPATGATVASNPTRDAALKDYLQKKFRIGSADEIVLGPMQKSALPGIYERQVTVSNEKGQSVSATLFTDQNETKAILGQYYDLGADAWGRVDLAPVHLDDRPSLGPPDAPITMLEFADFECPYCAHAFSVMETLVNTDYKGKIKLIYKNYPLNVHPWAIKAAQAAECARLQNPETFWDFARYFYTNQGSINVNNLQDNVDKLAKEHKLDVPSLKACMNSPQTEARIKQDQNDGNSIHVSSTPTFFVNGIPVVGLPDGKILEFVINSELAGKSPAAAAN